MCEESVPEFRLGSPARGPGLDEATERALLDESEGPSLESPNSGRGSPHGARPLLDACPVLSPLDVAAGSELTPRVPPGRWAEESGDGSLPRVSVRLGGGSVFTRRIPPETDGGGK